MIVISGDRLFQKVSALDLQANRREPAFDQLLEHDVSCPDCERAIANLPGLSRPHPGPCSMPPAGPVGLNADQPGDVAGRPTSGGFATGAAGTAIWATAPDASTVLHRTT